MLQKFGGIRNYFFNLIKTYAENPKYGIRPVVFMLHDRQRDNFENIKKLSNFEIRTFKNLLDILSPKFTNNEIDLVHNTYYLPLMDRFFPRRPHVTTIHDMIPELFKSQKLQINPHFEKRKYYETADGVISVSKTTSADLTRIYGKNQGKSVQIYHGVDHNVFLPAGKDYRKLDEYFIYVGKRNSYKNGMLALEAIEQLPSHIRLVLVGGGPLSNLERNFLDSKNLTSRVIQINVKSRELADLYRGAIGLIVTSNYEGFGLPLIESMASGCPVIAKKSDCITEICEDNAIYFDSSDAEILSDTLKKMNKAKSETEDLIQRGIAHSKKFSWEKCALETANFYSELA